MPTKKAPKMKCFLTMPHFDGFLAVRDAVEKAINKANYVLTTPGAGVWPDELHGADCIIADITGNDPHISYLIGLAKGMGKDGFLLVRESELYKGVLDSGLDTSFPFFAYELTSQSLEAVAQNLRAWLERRTALPKQNRQEAFFVDWDKLDHRDIENLCRELLMQMGFRNVDWSKNKLGIDIVAEYPKKDPDGFEYSEFWLVSTGGKFPFEERMFMHYGEAEFMLRDLFRGRENTLPSRSTITLLFILLNDSRRTTERIQQELEYMEKSSRPSYLRIRYWDRSYLTSLVQQYPQIGYKYFSDEGFSRLKYRKTPEELYKENTAPSNRQAKLITELQEEKNMRVRAERDAIWKDISFSAAHKIGNPIFAIETNLTPLEKRINEDRKGEAIEVIGNIKASVEKAKGIVDQFKSLTRAQEINPVPTLLSPILEDACKTPQSCIVVCDIDCPNDLKVEADPERLAECFDELASNAVQWCVKEEKRIQIQVTIPLFVPSNLDSSRQYLLIHFKDNGAGVKVEDKERIFDAFFTTRNHGTELGLALVRRIIEGHGGAISEIGIPGEGADFEIYLPLPSEKTVKRRRRPKKE